VKRKSALPAVAPHQTSLGLSTIMDRAVAAAHGVDYVHLAVFAIDIDRVYWLDPERPGLPFGWEVFLTEWLLLSHLDGRSPAHLDLIEAMCWPLVADAPGEPPLGGQIVFAVYDAVQRETLPKGLSKLFVGWRSPPRDLIAALSELHSAPAATIANLCRHCLEADVSPPLAPPTREALLKILSGELTPAAASSSP
jgi:hypothetical protein